MPTPIGKVAIDWSRTTAWGDGGYYGRCFMNVRGREPEGTVDPADYERVLSELIAGIEAITDERGTPIGSRAFRPEDIYRDVRGVAPDLIVYFGDLRWRSVGAVGMPGIHTFENDTGPDEANHDWYGIFVLSSAGGRARLGGDLAWRSVGAVGMESIYTFENDTGPDEANHDWFGIFVMSSPEGRVPLTGNVGDVSIYDIAPTLLTHFGCAVPADMIGRSLLPA